MQFDDFNDNLNDALPSMTNMESKNQFSKNTANGFMNLEEYDNEPVYKESSKPENAKQVSKKQ